MEAKPFGKELLIDLYGVSPEKCDNLELTYRFLEELVVKLGMTAFTNPLVFHGGRDKDGNELYPDKAGVTGFIGLITSSIVVHTINDKGFVSIDVYTCGELTREGVMDYICSVWNPERHESTIIERGISY
jgi:S-adenosylmethionine decarboxylase